MNYRGSIRLWRELLVVIIMNLCFWITLLFPVVMGRHVVAFPATIAEEVETLNRYKKSLYVQYWEARRYHGTYVVYSKNGTMYFERDGEVIEYKR